MQKGAKTTDTTLAARRIVLLRNRFVRVVSTCRQNRSFVTRRTKPGNSGRLPPSAAVQGRSSGGQQQAVEAVAVPSVPSAMARVPKPARPLLRSRAPQLQLQAGPQWCGGRGPGSVPCCVPSLRSWHFFSPAVSSEACSWPEGLVQDLLSCQKGF